MASVSLFHAILILVLVMKLRGGRLYTSYCSDLNCCEDCYTETTTMQFDTCNEVNGIYKCDENKVTYEQYGLNDRDCVGEPVASQTHGRCYKIIWNNMGFFVCHY